MTFFCATLTCVQMYTRVTPVYLHTPNAYFGSSQESVYCVRSNVQYVCAKSLSASSTADLGVRPNITGLLDW
jgi:hypothetical protein